MTKQLRILKYIRDNTDKGVLIHEVAKALGYEKASRLTHIPSMKYIGYLEQERGGRYRITERGIEKIKEIETGKVTIHRFAPYANNS